MALDFSKYGKAKPQNVPSFDATVGEKTPITKIVSSSAQKKLADFLLSQIKKPAPVKSKIGVADIATGAINPALGLFVNALRNPQSQRAQNLGSGAKAVADFTGIMPVAQDISSAIVASRLLKQNPNIGINALKEAAPSIGRKPAQIIGDVGQLGLNLLGGGGLGEAANAVKTAKFIPAVAKAALEGAKFGGAQGLFSGMSEGKKGINLVKKAAQNALIGGAIGGGAGLVGEGISRGLNVLLKRKSIPTQQLAQELLSKETPTQIDQVSALNNPLSSQERSLQLPNPSSAGRLVSSQQPSELSLSRQSLPGLNVRKSLEDVINKPSNEVKLLEQSNIPDVTKGVKERGFITSVKESSKTPKEIKDIITGSYNPKSNESLKKSALKLIETNPAKAEELALNPRNATDVQIGNELINYHASQGNFAKARDIGEGMAKSGTEFGRAVQAFSLYDKTSPEGALKFAQSKINKYNELAKGNKKINLSDAQVKELFDKAHKIQSMPLGRERNIAANKLQEHVNNLIPSTIADKAIAVWKAGLLTSLRTHERNLLGNTVMAGSEVAKDIPASFFDRLMALRTGKRSTSLTLKGLGSGTKSGAQSAKDIVKYGFDPEEAIAKFDINHITWGNSKLERGLKKYTDVVFRTLGAEDKPFWKASFARSLYDQAGAEAINAGKRGNKEFIKSLVQNPSEEMKTIAIKDANTATFHDKNVVSNVVNSAKRALGKNEYTKVISETLMPFTSVPSSILTKIIDYSPVGLAKGIARAGKVVVKNVPELQRQAAQELGRGVIGSGITGLGAYLASKGLLTGNPKDAKESRQWELEGKKANSILIAGKWRSINSIGPQGIIALAGAKAQQELGKNGEGAGALASSIGKDFLQQSFLAGVQGPLNAITDPARYGQSYIKSQIGSVIPNILKDVSSSLDPYKRETNTTLESLQYGIPGLRNFLSKKRDALGNPIKNDQSGVSALIDLFSSSKKVSSPVINELARLNNEGFNAVPSKLLKTQTIPSTKKGQKSTKVTLTPKQLNEFTGKQASTLQSKLQELINSANYKSLSDEEKASEIGKVVSKVRSEFKKSLK